MVRETIRDALDSKMLDFEDAVQAAAAKNLVRYFMRDDGKCLTPAKKRVTIEVSLWTVFYSISPN